MKLADVRRTGGTQEVIDLLWFIAETLERIEKAMPAYEPEE